MVKYERLEEVMKYLSNHTWKETAKHFNITEMTISRWKKLWENANTIDSIAFTNKIKTGINKLTKKKLVEMSATELKLIYAILTGKFTSMRKDQYLLKIERLSKKVSFSFINK